MANRYEETRDLKGMKFYTLAEIKDMLGDVTDRTLRNYMKTGKLKGVKIAGKWRIKEEDLREFLKIEKDA